MKTYCFGKNLIVKKMVGDEGWLGQRFQNVNNMGNNKNSCDLDDAEEEFGVVRRQMLSMLDHSRQGS